MLKPDKITLHKQSKTLEVVFADKAYILSAEFLRVHSSSAEVRGHGIDKEVLVSGKLNVSITRIKPAGNYGIQIVFSDDHDSGIYSWQYLQELAHKQQPLWKSYLEKLAKEGKSRDPDAQVLRFP